MVQTTCIRCKKPFDKGKENYCKGCFESQILKGQCLNMAAALLRNNLGEVTSETPTRVFELTKRLYEEGITQKFNEW